MGPRGQAGLPPIAGALPYVGFWPFNAEGEPIAVLDDGDDEIVPLSRVLRESLFESVIARLHDEACSFFSAARNEQAPLSKQARKTRLANARKPRAGSCLLVRSHCAHDGVDQCITNR